MGEVGADPALVYAFQKTGVYVCEENERRLFEAQIGGVERRNRRVSQRARWSASVTGSVSVLRTAIV